MFDTSAFFKKYHHLATWEEARRAIADFVELTRPVQRLTPKPARMEQFLSFFDHPERVLRVIHLAGTSGKGSTTTYIASLLQSQGFHVGMTISPHLFDLRERLQIDGAPIEEEAFRRLLEEVFAVLAARQQELESLPHFFELITALAYIWFARQGVDYAVVETGLGGAFDATNVVRTPSKFAVFTPIDLDHQKLLGNTRAEIAREKSGIIVPGGRAWSAPQVPEVQEVLNQRTHEQAVTLTYSRAVESTSVSIQKEGTIFDYPGARGPWFQVELQTIGMHQAQNATLALDVVREVAVRDGWDVDELPAREALKGVRLPGRGDIREKDSHVFVFDVAHNPQKMDSLLSTVRTLFPDRPFRILLGLNSLDHAHPLADICREYDATVAFAGMEVGDVYQKYLLANPGELVRIFLERGVMVQGTVSDFSTYIQQCLRMEADEVTIICGSFYLVSYALPIFDQMC